MSQLAEQSARLVVMAQRAVMMLRDVYGIGAEKIDLVPHGIPDMPFVDPNFYKDQFGVEGKNVLLTFGLLSPNKGIEHVLRALPEVLRELPNTIYIVLGATHPNLVREQGESYRMGLERLTRDLGLKKHVIFYNRFVELHELLEFMGVADLYITPYLNPAQITSGTLAYAFGCGKAVISTPYWHAEELLAEDRGVLVPFGDSEALAREICGLLRDDSRRHAMRKRAYLLGREMIWSNVAHLYVDSMLRARQSFVGLSRRRPVIPTLEQRRLELPRLRTHHLLRMTDSAGMIQHATFNVPNLREGYCTDDTARALVVAIRLEELGQDTPEVQRAASTYAAFVDYAFDPQTGRFRNFMSFDRRWLEETGADDALGRAIWALGACIGRSDDRGLQFWAMQLFDRAVQACLQATSPRCWALGLVGIHEYLRRLGGDRLVNQARETLAARLLELYDKTASDDWPWFEDIVSYCNSLLPHALILCGHSTGNATALEVGLRSLRWLCQVQRSPKGCFRPIGSNGFYRRGEEPAQFDQQPVEAQAMVSACIEAYHATDDPSWLDEAHVAFEWFLGRNDLGAALYDSRTGGCSDGLLPDRVNQNQGAESTLAFLLALAEMRLLHDRLAAFDKGSGSPPQPALPVGAASR